MSLFATLAPAALGVPSTGPGIVAAVIVVALALIIGFIAFLAFSPGTQPAPVEGTKPFSSEPTETDETESEREPTETDTGSESEARSGSRSETG
ncbi:hypothetical protein [Natrinema sp. 74]|uniref:hypothetical protein n=1 Tax=Natrinema sp. 74 TaxID=3384159 RepID=UPI0038D44185